MNLKKQLNNVYIYSFLSTLKCTDAIWVALLAARGFSLAQVGLAEAVFHLVSLVCEVPSGMAADLLGRRRSLVASGIGGLCSALVMAFAHNFWLICLAMGVKAVAYNLISGTQEALTYDSLKTAGREGDYLKIDANVTILQRVATALGALGSLLTGVLRVTERQAAREKLGLHALSARLRVHILESAACLRSSALVRRLIAVDAVVSLPSYLTTMFVQQRLTALGVGMQWLFLPGLLAGAAGIGSAALARRLHPRGLRRLYLACALVCGCGALLAGAAPAWGCLAGPVLVQGAVGVWFLHSMQRLNDAIASDRRATLISVDSMAYSLLMIPASPLAGWLGDVTGQPGAGLCVLGALVAASGLAAQCKTRYNGGGAS